MKSAVALVASVGPFNGLVIRIDEYSCPGEIKEITFNDQFQTHQVALMFSDVANVKVFVTWLDRLNSEFDYLFWNVSCDW